MIKECILLAIETSCDECAASVVSPLKNRVKICSNVVFSQIDHHRRFGGVVPEIASRNHLEMLSHVVDESLANANIKFSDLSAIAVTNRPGLIGALLVGVSAAKSMAYALGVPLVPVNHLDGHLHSLFISNQGNLNALSQAHLPLLVCLVSGGHTNLYLVQSLPPNNLHAKKIAESRDDAAGEAFDKCAKLMGLSYPGGIQIDRLAKSGDKLAYKFPNPMKGNGLEFSFSGIKTALATRLRKDGYDAHKVGLPTPDEHLPKDKVLSNLCASIQEAIVQTLWNKISLALEQTSARGIAIVGGVSANSRLREVLNEKANVPVFFPELQYCNDNAAMIGAAGIFSFLRGEFVTEKELLKINAFSTEY